MSEQPETLSWERLDGESAKAYEAFLCYLHLPPSHVSILNAWRKYRGYPTFPFPETPDPQKKEHADIPVKAPDNCYRWANEFEWEERRRDYVNARERARLDTAKAEHREQLETFRKELRDLHRVALRNVLNIYSVTGFRLQEQAAIVEAIRKGDARPEQLGMELSEVPSFLRAASQTAAAAADGLATALGVEEVLDELDRADPDDA